MPPQFLITRPSGLAQRTARRLQTLGWGSLIAPMVSIVPTVQPPFLPPAMPPPVHASVHAPAPVYQAVLITSQHGLQQWAMREPDRGTPMLCVGGASADLAKALGFVRVETAAGDADSLASLVIARLSPQAGALVHPTGQGFRAQDWSRLRAHGFVVDQPKLYRQQPISELPAEAIAALRGGTLTAVLFYAPRSARLYGRLVMQAGLMAAHHRLSALCLSDAVARAAGREMEAIPPSQARQPHKNSPDGLAWQRIMVAKQPTEANLLDQLVEVWGRP
ncbi:MAG: uroporphyrinogen-III synthase [Rhodospirillaceae bacterium]|nr:uroporphyrinogen-III synthase [Rhodospirillaceae bacterium]